MNALTRETPGYSDAFLESMLRRTRCPSEFFSQPISVRGVCFAAGEDSRRLADEFAQNRLGLGTVCLPLNGMSPQAWAEATRLFSTPRIKISKVGFLLLDLDHATQPLQEAIAHTLGAPSEVPWFATATDHRKLIPELKLRFVVYLGLGSDSKMRVLLQTGQTLLVDQGTLQRPSKN